MKSAAAAVGATAALAAIGLSYSAPSDTQLFHNEILTAQDYEFMRYVSEYGKSYGTKAEFLFRLAQFKQTMDKIEEHNSSNGTHQTAINHMADWTQAEYKKLLGYRPEFRQTNSAPTHLDDSNLADGVDWVTKGAVTAVKNQGQCGSCWAFSTTGSLEGALQIAGKGLTPRSEQQLVDCAGGKWGNQGCNGGLMDLAFAYIKQNPLATETAYPYTGKNGTCKTSIKGDGSLTGFTDVTPKNPSQLKAALMKNPVSVAIEADTFTFQMYSGGVITSSACGTNLDHGVLAVGYGTESGQEYFLVKNSWGAGWGVNGYVKIGASQGNICGILSQPSFPTE